MLRLCNAVLPLSNIKDFQVLNYENWFSERDVGITLALPSHP